MIKVASSFQTQMESIPFSTTTKELQVKEVGKPALFVEELNVTVMLIPESENTADSIVGGGTAASTPITLINFPFRPKIGV